MVSALLETNKKRKVNMKTVTANASRALKMAGDEIRAAADKVGVLQATMTFLVPLTEAERKEHRNARIGVQKLRLIATRHEAARQYRDHLPEAFDYRNFERDAVCTANLADLLKAVDVLRNAVHDTLLVTANRATAAAQSVYGYIQVGSLTLERLKRKGNTRTSHAATVRQAKAEMPSGETPAAASGMAPSAAPAPPSGTAPPVKVQPPSGNPSSAPAAPKAEVA
jgi:hypothetical protein